MQPERMRILEMLQEGKIDAEQALRLLEAVDKAAGQSAAAAPPPSPPRDQPEACSSPSPPTSRKGPGVRPRHARTSAAPD
jgi:hypothetical protein